MRIQITPKIGIEDSELKERFIRASGPGGQNVNKVATAVELRLNVAESSLPEDVKLRLMTIADNRINKDGDLLIDSREYRTQAQNREAARARLVALLRLASVRPKTRRRSRTTRAANENRLHDKHIRSEKKRERHADD